MADSMKELKRWENGVNKWDLQDESRKANDFLELYGRDQYTFSPETLTLRNEHLRVNEASNSHGYPMTAWL